MALAYAAPKDSAQGKPMAVMAQGTAPDAVSPGTPDEPGASAPAGAQPGGSAAPSVPARPPAPTLSMSQTERQYFELGFTVARAAFSFADLAKQAAAIADLHSHSDQVRLMAKLNPLAIRDRSLARDEYARALDLATTLHAPKRATVALTAAATELGKEPSLTKNSQAIATISPDAAVTMTALDEFEKYAALPEDPAFRRWLVSGSVSRAGQVWYSEGFFAGLANIASAQQMPELLPTISEIATDMRGMRDWLVLRLPEQPSDDQIALKKSLDQFLDQAAAQIHLSKRHRHSSHRINPSQLAVLGDISKRLEAQILPDAAPQTPTNAPEPTATTGTSMVKPAAESTDGAGR